jgi:zinc transport system permease protein
MQGAFIWEVLKMEILREMMSYPFLVRALIGGVLVALCASLLGVSLVLKRYSMIGDGLSHVSFGALSIAVAFGWSPLKISIPVVVLAAFFLLRITENAKIKSDAAIAMISAAALAIGIIVTSLTTGMTTDVSSYMFGSILAMSRDDVRLSVILSVVVLGLFVFCYNKIFAVTFDESFAKATGVNVSRYNVLISILTAITIVLGMRMMGAMLISSLIIFPALTSMRIFKSFRGVVLSSGILSMVCFLIGLVLSYQYSTPAGASVVIVNLSAFLLFSLIGMILKMRKGDRIK